MKRMKRLVVRASAEYRTKRAKEALLMSSYGYEYASNLPPGVTTADIDRAAYGYDYDDEDGQWWDDEAGCWRDGTRGYCTRCQLEADAVDNESGLCAECVAEITAAVKDGGQHA